MQSGRRPSPTAILVAAAAVVLGLVGTALAGPGALVHAVSKSQVKKIAKKQANAVVDSRAATLDVNSAKTADSAKSANSATNAQDSAKLDGRPASAYASSNVEAYHEVGTAGEPGFAAGWTNDNPAVESTAAFYKDPLGVVRLKGMVLKAGGTGVIFVLPVAYRPPKTTCLPTVRSLPAPATASVVCAFGTGEVSAIGGDGTYLLEGMTFRAG
jgi:hypothetical protein